MHPNFLAICSYFAPLILNAVYIGFGSTVLLTSHIGSAAVSLQFQRSLMENFDFNEMEDMEDLTVPTDEEITNFFESLAHKRVEFYKDQVIEVLQFYFRASETAGKSIIEIASEAMMDDAKDPHAILKKSAFMDNGKKSDIYGYLKMMRNVSYESAKRSVNQRHLLKKEQLEDLSRTKLESMYSNFMSSEGLTTHEPIESFCIFLNEASKNQLRRLGIDVESHIFNHREEYATNVSESSFDPHNINIQRFLRYIIKTMAEETIQIEKKKSDLDDYIYEVVKDSGTLISNYLQANPINYEGIHEVLGKIDEHVNSAALISIRVPNFIYGTELAPYPKFLVREIISKDNFNILTRLTTEHPQGIRGVYAKDQEEIFIAAYEKDKIIGGKQWKWIKLLTRTGFEFSSDQKKALFRDIMKSDDCDLLHLLVESRRLNLFEYQKDRGITFYHLLLIDGGEELVEHVHANYIIEEPQLKVKFIPNYRANDQEVATSTYWSPEENNFNLNLPNFDCQGMRIRKNWDFLMIAAAAGRTKIVKALMDKSVDTSGYERIKEHLKGQSVISALISGC